MVVINPFDFFLEPEAENFPFAYAPELKAEAGMILVLSRDGTPVLQPVFYGEREADPAEADGEPPGDLPEKALRLAAQVQRRADQLAALRSRGILAIGTATTGTVTALAPTALGGDLQASVREALAVMALVVVLGLLMVSTLRYRSFKDIDLRRRRSYVSLLGIALLGGTLLPRTWRLHRAKVLSTSALRCRIAGGAGPAAIRLDAPWRLPPDFFRGFTFRRLPEEPAPRTVTGWDPETSTLQLDAALELDRAAAPPDARGQHDAPAPFGRRLGDRRQDGGACISGAVTGGTEVGHPVGPCRNAGRLDAGDDGLDQRPVHPSGRRIRLGCQGGGEGQAPRQQQEQGPTGARPADGVSSRHGGIVANSVAFGHRWHKESAGWTEGRPIGALHCRLGRLETFEEPSFLSMIWRETAARRSAECCHRWHSPLATPNRPGSYCLPAQAMPGIRLP